MGQTLASFDTETQARATTLLARFTGIYGLSPSFVSAEELGAAVDAAIAFGGDLDTQLDGQLLRVLHQRMVEYAARGDDVPTTLDAAAYAKLRRSLEQRFGAIAPTPPA